MRFLVFDMDGILVDTSECHRRAYTDLWRKCGIEGPDYRQIAGRPTREVVEHYTRELAPAPEAVRDWTAFKQERARQYLATEPVVFSDVLPCLAAMRRSAIGMAVATGASRMTAELLLERAGIAGFFQFVLTAEDVRAGKPDPEVYRRAVALSGADAAQTAVVEDSASGLQAAAAASTYVACVRSGLTIPSPFFLGSYAGLVEFAAAVGVTV